jgi:hypothetical protein
MDTGLVTLVIARFKGEPVRVIIPAKRNQVSPGEAIPLPVACNIGYAVPLEWHMLHHYLHVFKSWLVVGNTPPVENISQKVHNGITESEAISQSHPPLSPLREQAGTGLVPGHPSSPSSSRWQSGPLDVERPVETGGPSGVSALLAHPLPHVQRDTGENSQARLVGAAAGGGAVPRGYASRAGPRYYFSVRRQQPLPGR